MQATPLSAVRPKIFEERELVNKYLVSKYLTPSLEPSCFPRDASSHSTPNQVPEKAQRGWWQSVDIENNVASKMQRSNIQQPMEHLWHNKQWGASQHKFLTCLLSSRTFTYLLYQWHLPQTWRWRNGLHFPPSHQLTLCLHHPCLIIPACKSKMDQLLGDDKIYFWNNDSMTHQQWPGICAVLTLSVELKTCIFVFYRSPLCLTNNRVNFHRQHTQILLSCQVRTVFLSNIAQLFKTKLPESESKQINLEQQPIKSTENWLRLFQKSCCRSQRCITHTNLYKTTCFLLSLLFPNSGIIAQLTADESEATQTHWKLIENPFLQYPLGITKQTAWMYFIKWK